VSSDLEHESQQDDHGHTRHHIRVILDDKLMAQHGRTLVLLAEAHCSSSVAGIHTPDHCRHSLNKQIEAKSTLYSHKSPTTFTPALAVTGSCGVSDEERRRCCCKSVQQTCILFLRNSSCTILLDLYMTL